jgi:2-dehydropantoate 2-reductase
MTGTQAALIKQWHILGAGAIGRLFACKLARMNLEPHLVLRHGPRGSYSQQLRLGGETSRFDLPSLGVDQLRAGEVPGLLVTTKANDAAQAVTAIADALAPGAPVILLHNGMGVLEQLSSGFPGMNLLAATTTEGAWLDGEVLVHAGQGETVVGQQQQPAPEWFAPFADSRERFRWTADIDAALWKKLLINCAINPLTAVNRCANGALAKDPALREQVRDLCRELAAVSRARGQDLEDEQVFGWTLDVIERTAANQSSMLQDVLQDRETEIRYITGYLVAEASRLGVPCPLNEGLLAQLDSMHLSN